MEEEVKMCIMPGCKEERRDDDKFTRYCKKCIKNMYEYQEYDPYMIEGHKANF